MKPTAPRLILLALLFALTAYAAAKRAAPFACHVAESVAAALK